MIKRPFFSIGKPGLRYPALGMPAGEVRQLRLPGKVTLLVKGCDTDDLAVRVGAEVLTGQRLALADGSGAHVMSTVTGVVRGLWQHTGYLNESYAAVDIEVSGEDRVDESVVLALGEATYEAARGYLSALPGKADFLSLLSSDPPVNTVVVNGMDQDLMVSTCRYVLESDFAALLSGIEVLKQVARVGRVVVAVPEDLATGLGDAGVDVLAVSPVYPSGLRGMIARDILGDAYDPGKGFEQMGLGFISAEAVVALGRIFSDGELPLDKLVTVIGKDGSVELVKVRMGTAVADVLTALGIATASGDRVVLGGPMTGVTIHSDQMPILADTDAVMVQDGGDIILSDDVQCVNCGECVRVCPVKVPVNMLVRVLSSGLYEEAADMYDLHCCIECGLCDYVCVARIPIFHHIMLGKHECARINDAEGING